MNPQHVKKAPNAYPVLLTDAMSRAFMSPNTWIQVQGHFRTSDIRRMSDQARQLALKYQEFPMFHPGITEKLKGGWKFAFKTEDAKFVFAGYLHRLLFVQMKEGPVITRGKIVFKSS